MANKKFQLKKTVKTLKNLKEMHKGKSIRRLLYNIHPADLAEIFPHFNEEEQAYFFRLLDINTAGEVLDASNETIQQSLINNSNPYFIAAILEKLYTDEAADILGHLSVKNANNILDLMQSEDAKNIKELMVYEPYTAGRVMTLDYMSLDKKMTARQAIEITQKDYNAEMTSYIYVTDDNGILKGVLPFEKLVYADPESKIEHLINPNIKTVFTDTDQEEAVRLVRKYDLMAIPVVSKDFVLKGIITVDDIIEILKDENSEDFFRLAGTAEKDPVNASVLKKVGLRLPWLLITLFGGIGCSYIMNYFDSTLEKTVAIAFFSPLILGLAGNISIQSSTVIVRSIATGEISSNSSMWIMGKEIISGIITGALFGVLAGISAGFMQQDIIFGLSIFISICFSILTAAIYGTFIPVFCNKIKIDPALASGPFVLILTDVSALFIYLNLSSLFLDIFKK